MCKYSNCCRLLLLFNRNNHGRLDVDILTLSTHMVLLTAFKYSELCLGTSPYSVYRLHFAMMAQIQTHWQVYKVKLTKHPAKPFPGRSSIRFLCPFGLSTAEKVKSFCHSDTCMVVRGTYCTDFEDWDLNLLNSPGAVHSVPSCNTEETRHRSQRSQRQAGEEKGAPQASEQYEKFSLVCKSF